MKPDMGKTTEEPWNGCWGCSETLSDKPLIGFSRNIWMWLATVQAMHAQVGQLVLDEDGLGRHGLLIRHLVMPGCLEETIATLEWIAAVSELAATRAGSEDQCPYRPDGTSGQSP
jgi:hypothetical protein